MAGGTALVISGKVDASQAAQYTSTLPGQIRTALGGTPFSFYHAYRSDPLGLVPGSLPAQPASAGNLPIAEAASLEGITAQAVLVSGHWPGAPAAGPPSGAIPAALPVAAAALLHVTDGDVLRLKDRVSGQYVRFVVTGLYRPRQVSSPYWGLNDIPLSGSSTVSGFTTYGPLTVQAAAFAGPLTVSAGSWLAQPQTASIPPSELSTVAGNVQALQQALQNAPVLPGLALTTSLPSVLLGTASNLDVARSLLAVCAVLLFLLAAAALLAVARMLTGQREGESAMLTARGATRWQLVRLTAAEAIPLCALSAAAGGVFGVLLARLLARTGGGGAGDAWPAAAAVAAGALVIMVVPVLGTLTPGAARARRGRQAAISGITRAGADLALVLLAVVAGWQLRHYSAASAGANGTFGVDPVVVIAPALALAGGTVLALRLLPAGGKAGDRLAARGRRLTAALASWQISRQPIRQGGAALLIVLATATVTLALAQRQSWTGSDHDQAAFNSGADVRVETSQPLSAAQAGTLVQLRGVRHAMPVASFTEAATNSETIAVDSAQAASVSLLRPDQSALPEAALFAKIIPAGPATGVTLPGRAGEVRLTARLGPASLRLAPATVSVAVAGRRRRRVRARRGHAARRRPGSPAGRHPGRHPRRAYRGHRGGQGHLSAAADRDQPGLHDARDPPPRPGHLQRGQRVRRPGDGPDRRRGAARLAGRGLVRRAGGRPPADPGHQRPVRPARRLLDRCFRPRHAGRDVQPGLRAGVQRVSRLPAHLGRRTTRAELGPARPGHPRPGHAWLPGHEQRQRRIHRADRYQRHHHQRADRRGGDHVPHRVRARRCPHHRPRQPPGHPERQRAAGRAGHAVVAGHVRSGSQGSRPGWPPPCRRARPSPARTRWRPGY